VTTTGSFTWMLVTVRTRRERFCSAAGRRCTRFVVGHGEARCGARSTPRSGRGRTSTGDRRTAHRAARRPAGVEPGERRRTRAGRPAGSARGARPHRPPFAPRWPQQQVLRPLERRRDLERRERLALGLLPAREQVALGQVAVRGGLVGRPVASAARNARIAAGRSPRFSAIRPSADVRPRVERVQLHDALVREAGRHVVGREPLEGRQPARRLDGGVVVRQQRPVFADRARDVAQLLGQPRHDGVGAVLAGRHRHERGRLLERLVRRRVPSAASACP
jgi:hypothetical protein